MTLLRFALVITLFNLTAVLIWIGVKSRGRPFFWFRSGKSPRQTPPSKLVVFNGNWPLLGIVPSQWDATEAAFDQADYPAALAHASRQLQESNDDHTVRAMAHLYRGMALIALGEREKAPAEFEAAQDAQLNRITQFAVVEAKRLLGDTDQAIAELSLMLEKTPGYLFAAWQRAEAVFQKGEYDRALADWYRSARLDWPSPNMFRVRPQGVAAVPDLGVLLTAVRGWAIYYSTPGHTDTDTSFTPNDATVHQQAISECNRAIQEDPSHASAYCLRGAARWHIDDFVCAQNDLNEAIRLDPHLAAAHRYRGLVLQQRGEYRLAITALSEAARLASENPDNHAALAALLASCPNAKLRDPIAAVEYGTLACQISKWKDPDHLTALSVALAAAGKYKEAITWQSAALMFAGYRKRRGIEGENRLKLYGEGRAFTLEDLTVSIKPADRMP